MRYDWPSQPVYKETGLQVWVKSNHLMSIEWSALFHFKAVVDADLVASSSETGSSTNDHCSLLYGVRDSPLLIACFMDSLWPWLDHEMSWLRFSHSRAVVFHLLRSSSSTLSYSESTLSQGYATMRIRKDSYQFQRMKRKVTAKKHEIGQDTKICRTNWLQSQCVQLRALFRTLTPVFSQFTQRRIGSKSYVLV